MLDFLARFADALWVVFRESSFYLLLGFTAAGLLHALVPASLIRKLLGRRRIRSILVASLVGVPLPLCSCSVVPTAIALRRRGASRGATVSFLVSTPETGVDSITLTWGLMGWLMAVFRPLAAFVTALVAGLAVEIQGPADDDPKDRERAAPAPVAVDPCCGTSDAAPAAGEPTAAVAVVEPQARGAHGHGPGHSHDHDGVDEAAAVVGLDGGPAERGHWLTRVMRYGFRDLLDDLSHWLLFGLIVSALVSAFVPATVVERFLGRGIMPMLMMALIGVPLYICASASTPIAASLMLKGMSPGAALVFLLTGPATNVGSIVLLTGYFGRRVVATYVAVVAALSIAFGMLLDLVIASTGIKPVIALGAAGGLPGWLQLGATLVFVVLLLGSVARAPVPAEFARFAAWVERGSGFALTRRGLARAAIALAIVGWLSTGLLTVSPGERGAILRFGRLLASDLEPGTYVHAPAPIGRGTVVAVDRSRTLDVGFRTVAPDPGRVSTGEPRHVKDAREGYFLTGDENIVDVNLTVEFRVNDPVRFGFQVADPDALMRAATRAAMVEVLGNQPIDEIYSEGRAQVERDAHRRIQDELDRYGAGIELTRVALLEVHAPTLVHWNFRDVASAREDAFTAEQAARGYVAETLPRARGEAAAAAAEAAAARVSEIARASAEASAFEAQASVFAASRDLTALRLYLEAMEAALPGVRKVVRPGAGGSGALDVWMMPSGAAAPASGAQTPAPGKPGALPSGGDDTQPESPFLKALRRNTGAASGTNP